MRVWFVENMLRPLFRGPHLTPGPLPHFVAERETDGFGIFERLAKCR
jgi:hypothetical protein